MKCCVYTRTFYESPYINFFIEHYLKLGFDKIFILKTDNLDIKINNKFLDFIEIKSVENNGDYTLSENLNIIKESNYDWFLNIDNDEFLFLESQYSNIKEYIKNILDKSPNVNLIYFRWVMVEKFNNKNISFYDLIKNHKLAKNCYIKSLIKTSAKIKHLKPHWGIFEDDNYEICFENLTNIENKGRHNLNHNSYNDSILLHIHTRSFNNLITKSLITKLKPKIINNKNRFKNFIDNEEFKKFNDNDLIDEMKKNIGAKFCLPFNHIMKWVKLHNALFFKKFKLFDYESKFLDEDQEKENLELVLKENNINIENYYSLSERVIKIVEDKKYLLL